MSGCIVWADRKISSKQLAALGWSRTVRLGYFPEYDHPSGWRITHCGHATANWPYLLIRPDGQRILQGQLSCGDPERGYAWGSVSDAIVCWISLQKACAG